MASDPPDLIPVIPIGSKAEREGNAALDASHAEAIGTVEGVLALLNDPQAAKCAGLVVAAVLADGTYLSVIPGKPYSVAPLIGAVASAEHRLIRKFEPT